MKEYEIENDNKIEPIIITMKLALVFDKENTNGFSISREDYERLLNDDSIKERIDTKTLFLNINYDDSISHMSNIIGSILSFDLDNMTVKVKIIRQSFIKCLDNYLVGAKYIYDEGEFISISNFALVHKKLSAYKGV